MNDNAKKWVEALRSGEFSQCQHVLHYPEVGYCCLGVACEIFRRETGHGRWRDNTADRGGFAFDSGEADEYGISDESDISLPWRVMQWLGIRTPEGEFDELGTLSQLNDAGKDFVFIADVIESEPQGLFEETT